MAGIPFYFDNAHIVAFLMALRQRSHESILSAGQQFADSMEQYAKQNAPWTDRTGNARRTLAGINTFGEEGGEDETAYYIGVCGNMPYSPELEIGHGQRYAILRPTLQEFGPGLLEEIRNVISRQEGINVK